MKLFAIICLLIFLIAIQHILQIVWRAIWQNENIDSGEKIAFSVLAMILTIIGLAVTLNQGVTLAYWIVDYYNSLKIK